MNGVLIRKKSLGGCRDPNCVMWLEKANPVGFKVSQKTNVRATTTGIDIIRLFTSAGLPAALILGSGFPCLSDHGPC